MCWDAIADLPCDRRAPALARRFVIDRIPMVLASGSDCDSVVDDAAIIASELVTNSVGAGCDRVRVTLVIHRDRLRLTVQDNAPGMPRLLRAAPQDEHGRGLAITASLAHAWGIESSSPGKQVWAEIHFACGLSSRLDCCLTVS